MTDWPQQLRQVQHGLAALRAYADLLAGNLPTLQRDVDALIADMDPRAPEPEMADELDYA